VPQLVTTGLNAKHRDAVVTMLAAPTAATVLASEGLAESYNIAEFLGKTPSSDVLHRPVPLHEIQGRLLRVCNWTASPSATGRADIGGMKCEPAPRTRSSDVRTDEAVIEVVEKLTG
jgi:hypothetical protein